MESSLIDRFSELIESKSLSERQFALTIGFSVTTLNNYMTGRRTKIDSSLIALTLSTFGDISPDWLILGIGPMHRTSEYTSREGLIQMYQDLLEVRDNKIRELEMKIIELESRNMSVG